MFKNINDYGIIGNLRTAALIGLDGSVDWLCFPDLDSPSVFGCLLDDKRGGRFSIRPVGEWKSAAEYIPGTNVLTTAFKSERGTVKLTDFMPVSRRGLKHMGENELYRIIEAIEGEPEVELLFEPRFNYSRSQTTFEKRKGMIISEGNKEKMVLISTYPIEVSDGRAHARWTLKAGEKIYTLIKYGFEGRIKCNSPSVNTLLKQTVKYWRDWIGESSKGHGVDLGPYGSMVDRSSLAIKLLYYAPIGTVAAAATTSLPEEIGGQRNWDYRYTWIRDASLTLKTLVSMGHISETEGYLRWFERLISLYGAGDLQIMYGLRGEEKLDEEEIGGLKGYKGSSPVRIGNAAFKQRQLDIYGELMDSVLKFASYTGSLDPEMWPPLSELCNHVADNWRERGFGIWEIRSEPRHYVYSKSMCWVALERGIALARKFGFTADLKKWEKQRDRIKEEVLSKGWSSKKASFVQHYETEDLDSSVLLLPIFGFLPFTDKRIISTIDAIQKELSTEGFLSRYRCEDGLKGREELFLPCTFWLIDNLAGTGRLKEAKALLDKTTKASNHLGLFSEEYDPSSGRLLGNFPQALTHIGFINSAMGLRRKMIGRRRNIV